MKHLATTSHLKTLRPRQWLGLALTTFGAWVLISQTWRYAAARPLVQDALWGGLATALATAIGTLPVLFAQRISERTQDTMFGFGAGVMLAASAFSLIVPGIAAAHGQSGSAWHASTVVGLAVLLGAGSLLLIERMLPHEHFIKGVEGRPSLNKLRRTWLFVFAITLHNLPEGLAVGVSYAGIGLIPASALTLGIAIQNVAEGLLIAVALFSTGYSRVFAVVLGMLSGLVEPIGALMGAAVVHTSALLLPWGLGFAAGAMLFVVSHEIIPESHRQGHEAWATGGLILGFVLMMVLGTALSGGA